MKGLVTCMAPRARPACNTLRRPMGRRDTSSDMGFPLILFSRLHQTLREQWAVQRALLCPAKCWHSLGRDPSTSKLADQTATSIRELIGLSIIITGTPPES